MSLNILTHAVHTGYQYDLAKTGHEFHSIEIPGSGEVFWDQRSRPLPRNFHRLSSLEDAPVKFDLILVHFRLGYQFFKSLDLPLIFKEHCLSHPFSVPTDWLERITCYSFASQTAAWNWQIPPKLADRKITIGMGMDLEAYQGYAADAEGILVVGQKIGSRGNEKGYDNLLHLSHRFQITIVGVGNEEISGSVGPAVDYDELKRHYRRHRIFLNPSNILGMSTLEAMATGAPIVTFKTVNSDVIKNGFNGFVVNSVDEAEEAINRLLQNRDLCLEFGGNARTTIRKRFSIERFTQRWNTLFQQAIQAYQTEPPIKKWQPLDLAQKSAEERILAKSITGRMFEYKRIGYDKRKIRLLRDGRVGLGAGSRELFWNVRVRGRDCYLDLSSSDSLTCRLKRESDGSWSGSWIVCEKMPILLSPIKK